jgi:hypothetical protein
MNEQDVSILYRSRLLHQREVGSVRSAFSKIESLASNNSSIAVWREILLSILLIETRERPRVIRALEWLISILIPSRETTCGMFQMTNSPFRFNKSVSEVVGRLEANDCSPSLEIRSLEQVARLWHGASTRQRGEALSYVSAMQIAISCLNS